MEQNNAVTVDPHCAAVPPLSRGRQTWNFTRHFLEMVIAMVAGMVLLAPLWTWTFKGFGWTPLHDRPALHAMVMATDMTIAMSAWMKVRGHGWRPIGEMAAAMYAPFLVLLIPLSVGVLDGHGVMFWGHVLMILAMLGLMLWRRDEYTQGHAHHKHA